MPVINPTLAPSNSWRFNSIDWLPRHTTLSRDEANNTKTGLNSDYPLILPAKQAIELYWTPRGIAITAAIIECDYFTHEFTSVPIFPSDDRPNGGHDSLTSGQTANRAHKLAWGLGALVNGSEDVEGIGAGYRLQIGFALNAITILSNADGLSAAYSMAATVSAGPTDSTDREATGRFLIHEDDKMVIKCGIVKFMWLINPTDGEPFSAPLVRVIPTDPHLSFTVFDAQIELDYIAWDFVGD